MRKECLCGFLKTDTHCFRKPQPDLSEIFNPHTDTSFVSFPIDSLSVSLPPSLSFQHLISSCQSILSPSSKWTLLRICSSDLLSAGLVCPNAHKLTIQHVMRERNSSGKEADRYREAGVELTEWRTQGEEGRGFQGSNSGKKKKE